MTSDLIATWNTRELSEQGIIEDVLASQVLFLDDLGVEPARASMAEYTGQALYMLLDRAARDESPTLIVSTNLDPKSMGDRLDATSNGARIMSRLSQLTRPLGRFPDEDCRKGR